MGPRSYGRAPSDAVQVSSPGEVLGSNRRVIQRDNATVAGDAQDGPFRERISLRLSLGSSPAPWALCSLTATFIAECCGELFSKVDGGRGPLGRDAIIGAVGFVLNELVENALKYGQHGDINVTVGLGREDIVCIVSNPIAKSAVPALRARLEELVQGDPGELLRRQVEANTTRDVKSAESGLGYLLLINDYGVHLGWELSPVSGNIFSVMARIPLRNEKLKNEKER